MTGLELPSPWFELSRGGLSGLEKFAGTGLTRADLSDDETQQRSDPAWPLSKRAEAVLWGAWVTLVNDETGLTVNLRLQRSLSRPVRFAVNAVVLPYDEGRTLTGADLRSIPVAAIVAAYERYEIGTSARIRIEYAVQGTDVPGAREPLPAASKDERFSALVARQFMAIEEEHPGENVAKIMAKINDKPLPSVQRWIAQSRKQGFLEPPMPKRGRDAE